MKLFVSDISLFFTIDLSGHGNILVVPPGSVRVISLALIRPCFLLFFHISYYFAILVFDASSCFTLAVSCVGYIFRT